MTHRATHRAPHRARLVRAIACAALLSACAAWLSACASLRGSWPGGVGAVLGYQESSHALRLTSVPAGGAAARAGLREGDVVLAIDGQSVAEMTLQQVVNRLRGEVGTRVVFRVRRGLAPVEISVERAAYRGTQL